MCNLSANFLLLLLLNPATLISLPELILSYQKEANNCTSPPDIHHRHRHEKQNPHEMLDLHCAEGKHTVELELVKNEGSRSELKTPNGERPQNSPSGNDKRRGDRLKKWYKRMGLY